MATMFDANYKYCRDINFSRSLLYEMSTDFFNTGRIFLLKYSNVKPYGGQGGQELGAINFDIS